MLTVVIILVIIIAVVLLLRMSSPKPVSHMDPSCSTCNDKKISAPPKGESPPKIESFEYNMMMSERARQKRENSYNSTVASRTFIPPSNPLYQANPNNPNLEYIDVNLVNHPDMQESYSYMNFRALHKDQRNFMA